MGKRMIELSMSDNIGEFKLVDPFKVEQGKREEKRIHDQAARIEEQRKRQQEQIGRGEEPESIEEQEELPTRTPSGNIISHN
jgi:hypothetical protein